MVEELLLRWLVTVGFAGTGCWFLVRGVRGASVADRISAVAHVVMSAGMIAMAWPWGMSLPVAAQVVVFSAAALWFCALLLGWMPSECREGRHAHAHHALMMGAMVWMLVTMPDMPVGSGGGGHHHHGNAASDVLAQGPAEPGPSGFVFAIGLLAGTYFVLASSGWISSALESARGFADAADADRAVSWLRDRALDATCHGVMSIGAGTMLWTML